MAVFLNIFVRIYSVTFFKQRWEPMFEFVFEGTLFEFA